MAEFDEKAYAASRGLEDAKAANSLIQATGQALVLINGGAATATLTFFAATYNSAKADSVSIHISVYTLGFSLILFAFGVVFGACVLGFQAQAVQFWSRYWGWLAGIVDLEQPKFLSEQGHRCNVKVGLSFKASVASFLLGIIAISLPPILENTKFIFSSSSNSTLLSPLPPSTHAP